MNLLFRLHHLFFLSILFLASCVSPEKLRKELVYFNQGIDSAAIAGYMLEEPVIQKGDLLQINISSRSASANLLFSQNMVQPNVGGAVVSNQSSVMNDQANQYLVDIASGDIKMPVLGVIHAEGLTKSLLEKEIIRRAAEFVNEAPVVNIRFMNFRVTFLGNVTTPGTKLFDTERVTFLQALGEVGGVAPGGDLKNILLFREINGKRTLHKIDLTKVDFLNTKENQLKQNDVVYVSPNDRQLAAYDIMAQRRLQYVNIGLALVNVIFVITNLFR
jgi:polysaccharide export outer membrane protein